MNIIKTIQTILDLKDDTINTIGNRPRNLTNENLPMIKSNYSASIKADGLRCFLYYDKNNIYSIINPFLIKELQKSNVNDIYLLDCEYIEELDEYYVFDILIHKSKDITKFNLKERIDLICNDLLSKNIKLKEIYNLDNTENIFKISKKIYTKKYKYKIDGIIYTPLYESYNNLYIYKWKPLEQQTIDFLIREITPKNSNMKIFNLFVSSNNNKIKNNLLKNKEYKELFPFITHKNYYFPSYFTPSPIASFKVQIVRNKNNVYGNYNNIVIKDNTIVEFFYDISEKEESMRWKPYKFRLDKTKGYLENFSNNIYDVSKGPNSWRTSISIFNYIQNPIDNHIIFGNKNINNNYYSNIRRKGLNIPLYKYNNYIKSYLYNTYLSKGDKVLDLAGGRGGDLHKIKNSNYVLHIDVIDKLLKEAKNRYNKMNTKPSINFLKFDLLGNNISKINKIKETRDINSFDLITCQFAFHYFCKNKKSIDFITNLINNNLKKNGVFIMTGYDGKQIFDMLIDKKYINYLYDNILFAKIIKKYDDNTFRNYGQLINVYIEKIGIPQDEYLINFDYINKIFKKYNINVIEEGNFNLKLDKFNKKLSSDEKKYIELHKYIVYKKE